MRIAAAGLTGQRPTCVLSWNMSMPSTWASTSSVGFVMLAPACCVKVGLLSMQRPAAACSHSHPHPIRSPTCRNGRQRPPHAEAPQRPARVGCQARRCIGAAGGLHWQLNARVIRAAAVALQIR